jgi:hypothetical protein
MRQERGWEPEGRKEERERISEGEVERERERVTVHQFDLSIHLLGCMRSRKLIFTNQIINL